MLELQQNLAVAVSTDRKKDVMIEQLDRVTQLIRIYIYKGIGNCAISSTAANRIVDRCETLHMNTVVHEHENGRGPTSIAAF